MVKCSEAIASFPPRFAETPSKLTKVYCCLKSYRLHCIVISCILLFSSVFSCCVVFPTQGYICQDFCNNLGEYAWTNSMTSWIQHFTKEIFMKICVEAVLKKIKVLQLKWSRSDTQMEPIHVVTWMHWIIVCIGFEQLLSHTLPQNDSDILVCGSECMFPLIETSLCAQALWVNVSRGLGRIPPSPYPSREQFAAKPKLGFTALNKPSHGTGQRARKDKEWETKEKRDDKKIKKYHVGMSQIRWSACALYLFFLQVLKIELGPFRVFFPLAGVWNWGEKTFLFMSLLPPYVIHQAFFTLVESFVFVPHHQST